MEFLTQPKEMCMTGDLSLNWKKFKNNFETYVVATGCKARPKEVQAAVLLHCIGEEARGILETLELTEEDKKDWNKVLKKLDDYFIPKTNVSVERHRFNTRVQENGESFDCFIGDLRKIANNCDFGQMKEELIKDRLVCGIKNTRIKDRLLREDELNLEKTIKICKAAEETEMHMKKLQDQTKSLQVAEVKKRPFTKNCYSRNQPGPENDRDRARHQDRSKTEMENHWRNRRGRFEHGVSENHWRNRRGRFEHGVSGQNRDNIM